MVWEFSIILILILANGVFSGAEIAIINSRKSRLQPLADAGDGGARAALDLAEDPNRFLSTVQVAITFLGMFAAAFGGASLATRFAGFLEATGIAWFQEGDRAENVAFAAVTTLIAIFSLILGELVPKRLALRKAETFARFVAPIMQFVELVARPLIWAMGRATNGVLFLLGAREQNEPSVSIDDIEHMIVTGTAEGVVQAVEQRVAVEALRLGERSVRQVMRPRIDLDALDADTPPDEVLGAVMMAGFSRLPVYEKDLDHILGYVHIKDLFRQHYMGWPLDPRKLMRPALFVPETMPLDRLLQLFQEQHNQLAIVLDEFGGTEGMVTLEDLISELVGEIRDEKTMDVAQAIIQRDENSWLLDGMVGIDEFCDALGLKQPSAEETRGFSTISGLILDELGRMPTIGESIVWRDVTMEVVDMDGQRIDRILATKKPS